MVNRSLYLVGFVGVQYLEKERLSEKITGWMDLVEVLARLELQHLQTDYDGLQKSFHQEWAFIQRVTPNMGRRSAWLIRPWKNPSSQPFSKDPWSES